MDNFTIKVEGEKELRLALDDKRKEIESAVMRQIKITATDIESDARRSAPSSEGRLRSDISVLAKEKEYTVGNKVWYAPFIEYGTRQHKVKQYDVPRYQKGTWKQFVSDIADWMRKKGITGVAPYVIARSIYLNGIKPQPYLTPAFMQNARKFEQRVRRAIRRATKR